jgi:hypothetical protein
MELVIRAAPFGELPFDGFGDAIQEAEIAIVQAKATRQFPNSLNRVQFRTVRREEIQSELRLLLLPPREMEPGSVVWGVVADQDHAAPGLGRGFAEVSQEFPERFPVKPFCLAAEEESAVTKANRSKVPHTLSRGMMKHHRVLIFWRDPHAAPRSLLLEMDFIHRPQVHTFVFQVSSKFFLCLFCRAGSPLAKTGRGLRRRKSR